MAVRPKLVVNLQSGELHQVALESELELARPVHWDRQANTDAGPSVDVVAAIDAKQRPTLGFYQSGQFLAGKGCHRANSIT